MPMIKKHNNWRAVRQRTAEGSNHWVNGKDRNAPIRAVEKTTNHSRSSCFIISRMTSRPHRLKKTSSMQSKRRDLNQAWLHHETNGKPSFYCYSPRRITTTFSTKMLVKGKLLVKQIEQSSLQLHLNSTEPEQVDSYKLLGVTIDSQLTFDQKRIAVLWKIRRSLPLDQRKLFL